MQISCNAVQDLVVLYHDKSLSPETDAEIREHLKTCKTCTGYYRAFRRLNQEDSRLPVSTQEEAPEFTKLARRLKKEKVAHRAFWIAGIVGCTAAGCCLTGLLKRPAKR